MILWRLREQRGTSLLHRSSRLLIEALVLVLLLIHVLLHIRRVPREARVHMRRWGSKLVWRLSGEAAVLRRWNGRVLGSAKGHSLRRMELEWRWRTHLIEMRRPGMMLAVRTLRQLGRE
jgi:hypothetical protein